MFQALDSFLLSRAKKFAHRLQRLTGLSSYFIARLGVVISTLSLFIYVLNYGHPFLIHTSSFSGAIMSGLCLLPTIQRSFLVQQAEDSLGKNVKPISLMIEFTQHYAWRLWWVSITVLSLVFAWREIVHSRYFVYEAINAVGLPLGVVVFSYFILVDPLPPGTSKLREWLGNLFFTAQLAPQKLDY